MASPSVPAVERFGVEVIEVPPGVHRSRMAISKMSEALAGGLGPGEWDGEGLTFDQFLGAQPDVETVINGGFFYYAKMEETYGVGPPEGKRVGDGVGLFKIREYCSAEAGWCPLGSPPRELVGTFRHAWLVQTKRGAPFVLMANLPHQPVPSFADHKYILTCSPLLLTGGLRTPLPSTVKEQAERKGPAGHLGHLTEPNHRSMIGQREDGTLVLVSSKEKLVFDEMQEVMEALGCWTAAGLDGGGSVFLWHEGERKVQGDGERLVGNAIVVFQEGA